MSSQGSPAPKQARTAAEQWLGPLWPSEKLEMTKKARAIWVRHCLEVESFGNLCPNGSDKPPVDRALPWRKAPVYKL